MNVYLPLICFVAGVLLGLAFGAGLVILGYRLGFKASYEIRNVKGVDDGPNKNGLFPDQKEPAEFDLLEEQEKSK